jgi:hypothetical protein
MYYLLHGSVLPEYDQYMAIHFLSAFQQQFQPLKIVLVCKWLNYMHFCLPNIIKAVYIP